MLVLGLGVSVGLGVMVMVKVRFGFRVRETPAGYETSGYEKIKVRNVGKPPAVHHRPPLELINFMVKHKLLFMVSNIANYLCRCSS